MATDKIILRGLKTEDYVHSNEKFFAERANIETDLDKLADEFVQRKGSELNQQTAPEVFAAMQEVCDILDYPNIPKIFIRHEPCAKVLVGANEISITESVVNEFDSQMKCFAFGSAVSILKGRRPRLATVNVRNLSATAIMTLQAYLRAANLSDDRGGLLCCQDFTAAARCILSEAGLSLSKLKLLSDEEILRLVENYLEQVSAITLDTQSRTSSFFKPMSGTREPVPIRLRELFMWYRDGYKKILSTTNSISNC